MVITRLISILKNGHSTLCSLAIKIDSFYNCFPTKNIFACCHGHHHHCIPHLNGLATLYIFFLPPPPIFIYLFIYFWLCWVFVAAHGLSLVAVSRGYSLMRCADFSLQWLLLLQSTGSRRTGFNSCGSQVLERRLSSCGAQA